MNVVREKFRLLQRNFAGTTLWNFSLRLGQLLLSEAGKAAFGLCDDQTRLDFEQTHH